MDEKFFTNRPIEPDTEILTARYAQYDGIPVLIEKWYWDGSFGTSCVVPLDKLEEAGVKANHFIKILKDVLPIEGQTTERTKDGFLFLNYNVESR